VTDASIEFLRSVPLFAGISDRGLREISQTLKHRSYHAGDALLGEGEGGVGFFIIESGTASVTKGGGAALATFGPGDHFGEVALLADSSRTATVTADTDVSCWIMAAWSFRPMLKAEPTVALKLLDGLALQVSR
jgi:CRP/FNR family cyclic AMP-dependent transcriptional regulator